jgi:nucleoside-diphosphate-sugar epimerase
LWHGIASITAFDHAYREHWGDGSVVRDFIFVDDVIDAIEVAAVHTGDDRIFKIGRRRHRSGHCLAEE